MKNPELQRSWWLALNGWLEKHRGRADFLFVYDRKQGRLNRCFDRNVALLNVDAETVSKLYQAAAEGRLGLLRPEDLKPHRLTTNPKKLIASEKEVSTAQQEPEKTEQEPVNEEQAPEKEEQAPGKEEETAVKTEPVPQREEQNAVKAKQTSEKTEQVPEKQSPVKEKQAPAAEEPERGATKAQETVQQSPVSKPETGLNVRRLERAAAEPVLVDRMRKAEEQYRQVIYAPKKADVSAPTEGPAAENTGAKLRIKQAAVLEQAEEMIRNVMPAQPEEELSGEQAQLAAALAEMILGLGEMAEEDEDERERRRLAREELIAAQNLFIWAAASDKRDREALEAQMEQLEWTDDWTDWEMEWQERLEDMAQELNAMDLAGASEDDCREKIRSYLDGERPARHEPRAEEDHTVSNKMWGNTLRHFCRFAASEVPLSIRHVQVAAQCQKIMRTAKEQGLSLNDLGLDREEQMIVKGTIEMGKLVERGLVARATLTTGHRLPRSQYRECLKDYLAMKGIEETLIPHVQNYQKEISTGDGPVSALQILMGNPGFYANDLRAKAGRTNIVGRLEQMDPHRVARMIRQGSDAIAEMGRRVMLASCQMGASPEPVRKPAAPQKGGPVR